MFSHFGDIHYSVLWKQLAPWALTLWEWNHACGSSCLRVLLKFKTLNPRGWFFSQQLAVCTLCKPNQSCPWFQTKSAWCLLASPPPKKCPPAPLSSQNDCHKGREAAPFPSSAAFLPPHLCGRRRRGGCFFSSWRRTRWWRRREMGGETFFGKSFILVAWGKNRRKTTGPLNLNHNTKKDPSYHKMSFRPKKMANTNVENP